MAPLFYCLVNPGIQGTKWDDYQFGVSLDLNSKETGQSCRKHQATLKIHRGLLPGKLTCPENQLEDVFPIEMAPF